MFPVIGYIRNDSMLETLCVDDYVFYSGSIDLMPDGNGQGSGQTGDIRNLGLESEALSQEGIQLIPRFRDVVQKAQCRHTFCDLIQLDDSNKITCLRKNNINAI